MEARQILKESGHRSIADKSFVQALTRKWGQLLEGIRDPYTKGVTAVLMENESQWLQNLEEETKTINVGSFTKFIFPVLRRVFPNLIANEIVSVQPMTAPIGAVFFFDYIYGSNKGQTAAGSIFPLNFDRNYSSEYVDGEQVGVGDSTHYTSGETGAAVLAWTPVRPFNASNGYSVVLVDYDPTTQVNVQTLTDNGTGSMTGNGTATINYGTGALTAISFSTAPATGDQILAYYYYDGELNYKVPQVQLNISKTPIQANPRRLKALWSSEAAEDLRAFHGLDAETELVSGIAQEIALEIDREVINDLFVNSGSATNTSGTFSVVPPAGINELDHLRSMITQISIVSNAIHKATLRAPANFIVTSPDISARLSQLTTHGDFRPLWVSGGASPYGPADMPRPLTQHGQFGIYKVGTLMNKWVVYEDPFFTYNEMLIGLKGANFLDAGYVWAPYIPLQVTPSFLDPADFSFRKGLRTRYGKSVLRAQYYGNLTVTGL